MLQKNSLSNPRNLLLHQRIATLRSQAITTKFYYLLLLLLYYYSTVIILLVSSN